MGVCKKWNFKHWIGLVWIGLDWVSLDWIAKTLPCVKSVSGEFLSSPLPVSPSHLPGGNVLYLHCVCNILCILNYVCVISILYFDSFHF